MMGELEFLPLPGWLHILRAEFDPWSEPSLDSMFQWISAEQQAGYAKLTYHTPVCVSLGGDYFNISKH